MALKHKCEFEDLNGDGWFILIYDEEYAGATLFECADSVGVPVPTSCVKKGRCRECLLEIEDGGR